jgi:hypothetical protein
LRIGREAQGHVNALRAAVADHTGRFVYCEGVARTNGVFGGQAWLLDTTDGRAVDVTWRIAGVEYFGVPFVTQAAVSATSGVSAPELSEGAHGVLRALWRDPAALDDAIYEGR